MAAKIPSHLIDPEPRRLSELQIGETAYLWSRQMAVANSGECFLVSDAAITERSVETIKVDRREDGYHVTVISRGTKWRAHLVTDENATPVASIREE